MSKTLAPWSDEQVAALNRYQTGGWMHPFTCSHCRNTDLVATNSGWVCPSCTYTQNWAHEFMLNDL